MATIQERKSGRYSLLIYDRETQRKRYVGTYNTRQEAVDLARELEGSPIRERTCKGCGERFMTSNWRQNRCRYRCGLAPNEDIPPRERDHWVYFCHNAAGDLLYVGLTSEGLQRHRAHAKNADWWSQVDTIRIEHYDSRESAALAEAAAIKKHEPPFNRELIPGRRRRQHPTP